MKHLKVVTINMCSEFPGHKTTLLDKWVFILSQIKGDIIFLQEIDSFNIEKLADELGLKILNVNHLEATSVLINPDKLTIVSNNEVKLLHSRIQAIYIGGLHLDDIPSVTHHMHHMAYKSSVYIPLNTNIKEIIKLCVKHRAPRVKEELLRADPYTRAIIAGDFNEPSHFDLDKMNVPVSKLFEKNGFIDTFRWANKILEEQKDTHGYTWPAGGMYKNEPEQRVDFIYSKNIKVIRSVVYDGGDFNSIKWLSDHKMVISDLEIS